LVYELAENTSVCSLKVQSSAESVLGVHVGAADSRIPESSGTAPSVPQKFRSWNSPFIAMKSTAVVEDTILQVGRGNLLRART